MALVSVSLRILVVLALSVLPPALAGWVVLSWKGAVVFGALGALAFFLASLLAEHGVARALGAIEIGGVPFRRTIARALGAEANRPGMPRVLTFPGPGVQALYLRSPLGSGSILLSQGFVPALEEDEIRVLIQEAASRLRAPGAVFRTFCLWIALVLARAGTHDWSAAVFLDGGRPQKLSPVAAVRFMAMYPWIRFFLGIGAFAHPGAPPVRAVSSDWPPGAQGAQGAQDARDSAMRKLELARRIYGSIPDTATAFAGLVNLSLER